MTEKKNQTIDLQQFEHRKQDHIQLALDQYNQTDNSSINRIYLIHEAIPDINFDDVSLETHSLGNLIPSPFFVSSMTAGHANAQNINKNLAEACNVTGWAMGVGSQRRQLLDKTGLNEWQEIRKSAPDVSYFGNIGLAQAISASSADIQTLVDSLQAKAMIIHCNPLQECIQPEGTPNFEGAWAAINRLRWDLSVPLIIKETGCGFSQATLKQLQSIGVAVVDVSGFGGTHWGRIEGARSHSSVTQQTAATFKNWGITTVDALLNGKAVKANFEMWASGGIRSGLDAAKLLALGAKRVGIAKPMLEAALNGVDAVIAAMQTFEYELKTALFCTGSRNLKMLQENHRWQISK